MDFLIEISGISIETESEGMYIHFWSLPIQFSCLPVQLLYLRYNKIFYTMLTLPSTDQAHAKPPRRYALWIISSVPRIHPGFAQTEGWARAFQNDV